MATATHIPVEEYLEASHEGPEPEYLDGEVVERALPSKTHSRFQLKLGSLITELGKPLDLEGYTELRVRVGPTRYRVVDVAFYGLSEVPEDECPSRPPFIAVEILSPSDRTSALLDKLQEYKDWGVAHVWVVRPDTKSFYIYVNGDLRAVSEFVLGDSGIQIPAELVFGG